MGIETAIGAIGIGSNLLGTYMQYGENKAARKRAQQVSQQAQDITGAPIGADAAIQGKLNAGQDSYLQYLRANPTALDPFSFNISKAFADLQANDQQNINDQAAQLSAGAGSLGARFGSGFASKDALLRERFATDIAARNAGIAQSSFNTALATGMSDYQSGQARQAQLLQLLSQNQLAQRGQQLQGLGLGASQPYPSSGALVTNSGSDIASLLTLMNYLKNSGGTTPSPTRVPISMPSSIAPNPLPGYPG